jgi:hypothetical protein
MLFSVACTEPTVHQAIRTGVAKTFGPAAPAAEGRLTRMYGILIASSA